MARHLDDSAMSQYRHGATSIEHATIALERFFIIWISLIGIACLYQLTSIAFAVAQVLLALFVLLLVWPLEQVKLFHTTRSLYAVYKLYLAELCVLVYLICASLSVLRKIQTNNFTSDMKLLLLSEKSLPLMWKLDIVASLSIFTAHLIGYHDICDRIHRKVLWIILGFRQYVGYFCYILLQEIPRDLERQEKVPWHHKYDGADKSRSKYRDRFNDKLSETGSCSSIYDSAPEMNIDEHPAEETDTSRILIPKIKKVFSGYRFIHTELRAIGARTRWSEIRCAFGFQRSPLQDFSLLVAFQGQEEYRSNYENSVFHHPQAIIHQRSRQRTHSRQPSMSSVVLDMIERHNALRIHGLNWTINDDDRLWTVSENEAVPPPFVQLPGTLQNFGVKALPDTGSSQNMINASFIERLAPTAKLEDLDPLIDKPLIAPDGQRIPTNKKIELSWTFEGESETHLLWFYVVENCSHDVIIGNRFLDDTATFEKHQQRLHFTKPDDPDSLPGNLVSEAQEEIASRRQLVSGTVNGQIVKASLDTGCSANLISICLVHHLGLNIIPLPMNNQKVKFANGRRGSTCGEVEVEWRFDDDPEKSIRIKCFVLPHCIHPIIFGVHFVRDEEPWTRHKSSLSMQLLPISGDAGVVGWFRHHKPDPKDVEEQKRIDDQHEKWSKELADQQTKREENQQTHLAMPSKPATAQLAPLEPLTKTPTRKAPLASGALQFPPTPAHTPGSSINASVGVGSNLNPASQANPATSPSTSHRSSNVSGTGIAIGTAPTPPATPIAASAI